MDTAQWQQEMVLKPMDEILVPINNNSSSNYNNNINNTLLYSISKGTNNGIVDSSTLEKKTRSQNAQARNCPRCNSTNTKFCYYNNYSLSQPRYFCKACKRYWTEGGSLRNIPVGGASRKIKKTASNSSSSKHQGLVLPHIPGTNATTSINTLENKGKDLNLGYDFKPFSQLTQMPSFENNENKSHQSVLDLLNGVSERGCGNSNNSFMSLPIPMYSSGFSSMPTLSFPHDGIGNSGYETGNTERVLFPFEDLKQVSDTSDHNAENVNGDQGDSNGYWSGFLGGGSW